MKKNTLWRLFTFALGLPLIILLVAVDELQSVFFLAITATAAIASLELRSLFHRRPEQRKSSLTICISLGICFPILGVMVAYDILRSRYILVIIALIITITLGSLVFSYSRRHPGSSLFHINFRLLLLFYPGLFLYFIIIMANLEHSAVALSSFFFSVYAGDGFAYLVGRLAGRLAGHRREESPILDVSPRKTLLGFIANIVGSGVALLIMALLFPHVYYRPLFFALFLGIFVGIAAILGDLAESLLKRSLQKKNSGNIIPGRGGILDSIDSLLFSAPIFYLGFILLYTGAFS